MAKGKHSRQAHRGSKYRRWRDGVLMCGGYFCSECGNLTELTADHILPSVSHPELRYDTNNGRILCDRCRVRDMLDSNHKGKFRRRVRVEL